LSWSYNMTWGYVAVAGATVATGVMSSRSADRARGDAKDANDDAQAFEQQKLDDWNDTYGGLQDNLASYYNNLTPEFYETQGLEAFQKEQQVATERIQTSLAQRGIEDSGIAMAIEMQTEQAGAEERATIRAQAPGLAAEEQRSFLQVGLGQNPGESYSRSLANNASNANANAQASEAAAGQAIGSAISTVGRATGDYLAKPATPTYTTDYSSPITNRPIGE
jgi:hypothetical protein